MKLKPLWTPGPWRLGNFDERLCAFQVLARGISGYDVMPAVALASGHGRDGAEMNARFVAAGPQIFNLLVEMLEFYAPDCEGDCKVEEHGPAGRARRLVDELAGSHEL